MHFSNKLADLERLVTSYDQKIKRQAIQINHLTAQVDSKADRSQINAMATLLNSKISTVKGEIKTKELVIERNQNQLRNLEADMTVRVRRDGRGVCWKCIFSWDFRGKEKDKQATSLQQNYERNRSNKF